MRHASPPVYARQQVAACPSAQAKHAAAAGLAGRILQMQRVYGNQATMQMLRSTAPVQRKLIITAESADPATQIPENLKTSLPSQTLTVLETWMAEGDHTFATWEEAVSTASKLTNKPLINEESKENENELVPSVPVQDPWAMYETDSEDDEDDPEHPEVELHNTQHGGQGELDGVRIGRKKIYEDKRGNATNPVINPNAPAHIRNQLASKPKSELAETWAQKQIYDKTVARIDKQLVNAESTSGKRKSERPVPAISDIKKIRHIKFRIESGDTEVKQAVYNKIKLLETKYPDWKFTVKFNAPAPKLAPEDDPSSQYYNKK